MLVTSNFIASYGSQIRIKAVIMGLKAILSINVNPIEQIILLVVHLLSLSTYVRNQ